MEETTSNQRAQKSQKGIGAVVMVVIIALVILAAVVGFGLMNAKKVSAPTTTQQATVSPATSSSEKTIQVTGQNFSFTPSTITVKKGDKVKIVFKSGGGFHNFVIDEFNVKTSVTGSGQSEEATFLADKSGTFEYYCSVGNHRAMGMKGALIVQ